MKPPSLVSQWITKIKDFSHHFCQHKIVAFTMDKILEDKWIRISGSGTCKKCGHGFMVIIPKDEKEYMNVLYPESSLDKDN